MMVTCYMHTQFVRVSIVFIENCVSDHTTTNDSNGYCKRDWNGTYEEMVCVLVVEKDLNKM